MASAPNPVAPVRPLHKIPRLVITHKSFSKFSHIGLGVSAMQTARALRAAGYIVEVWAINSAHELNMRLQADRQTSMLMHHLPITHLTISAPWIPVADLTQIVHTYTDIEFCVVSHSNIGFLQADPNAIRLLRAYSQLEQGMPNFHIAANSTKFQLWWMATYQTPMLLLSNIYPFGTVPHKPIWNGGRLRIGCFCAIRPQKNILTAGGAALEVGVRLRATDLEFWISGGRAEGGGGTILKALQEMYADVPRAKLVENNWASWPAFLATVNSMDLLLLPSYTESFSMVTADGIARGITSVVGDAIDWAPHNWVASTDSAQDIANKAIALLHDPGAIDEGITALEHHNAAGLRQWEKFLQVHP